MSTHMTEITVRGICRGCERQIHFILRARKWVTKLTDLTTWHCGDDPENPVKAHEPV